MFSAFEGFAQYILPLEWGYDEAMPLSQVARLLPYHNYIDADRCVGYINQMIDSVAAGRKIYYDLGREDAGLFSSADGREHPSPSSVPEADSRMSAPSMRDSHTPWR